MKNKIIIILLLSFLVFTGCKNNEKAEGDYSDLTIRIAQQYSMQYAPVYVMKEMQLLEKELPGVKLEWTKFGSGAAMNEALISGQLDLGFMGVPPALIAIDKGADYRIACGISVPPSEVVVNPSTGIESLEDINAEHKIAVPGVGSTQHIYLSMAAKEKFDDPKHFDNNLVAMSHPDAYTALISGTDVSAHFSNMPYIDLEIQEGMKSIISAEDLGGGASIIGVSSKNLHDNEAAYNALMKALAKAIELINNGDEEAMKIISETEKLDIETANRYVKWPGLKFTSDLYKVDELAEFMLEAGYLKNEYKGFESVTWAGAKKGE